MPFESGAKTELIKKPLGDRMTQFELLAAEANTVREKDKKFIRNLFNNFYNSPLHVGIGFQRAYGSILSGDFFDLLPLPDGNYLFVFADISGHGLPAYTTLIKLRSSISLVLHTYEKSWVPGSDLDRDSLIRDIIDTFTVVMFRANSEDYACINFAFILRHDNRFLFRFYNRSMLFPIVFHRREGKLDKVVNLNDANPPWKPEKGYILGCDMKDIVGESYRKTPYADYYLEKGDAIFFYSDGITEAFCHERNEEFGEKRLIDIVTEHIDFPPQAVINFLFDGVYEFIGKPERQLDDMTAVLMDMGTILE
jgi:sigma-B regulation protein RsbU (phosphoserine phosphatase)